MVNGSVACAVYLPRRKSTNTSSFGHSSARCTSLTNRMTYMWRFAANDSYSSSSAYLIQFVGAFTEHDWQRLWKIEGGKQMQVLWLANPAKQDVDNRSHHQQQWPNKRHLPPMRRNDRDDNTHDGNLFLFHAGIELIHLHGNCSAATTTQRL